MTGYWHRELAGGRHEYRFDLNKGYRYNEGVLDDEEGTLYVFKEGVQAPFQVFDLVGWMGQVSASNMLTLTQKVSDQEAADERQHRDEQDDPVNHPRHYTRGGIEVIDFLEAYHGDDPLLWQVGKYTARAGEKVLPGEQPIDAEIRDLEKAEFYLKRRIAKAKAARDGRSA
jgi:hypothetical protein